MLPPLNVSNEEIEEAAATLDRILTNVSAHSKGAR
jgi:acetylornithine/succinyldiaminopimelate/putrescine aminotransferase